MKRKNQCTGALLALFGLTLVASAQTPSSKPSAEGPVTDVAATFTVERAKVQASACSCFWLKGGSGDAAVTFYHGLGVALNITAEHATNIVQGINLGKFSAMVGPRYTLNTGHLGRHRVRVFGEALFGGVHGYDSLFPTSNGNVYSIGAFSMQAGVGSDVDIAHGFAIRPFEVDYVRTTLPNNGSNTQNDLRLAAGLAFRFPHR